MDSARTVFISNLARALNYDDVARFGALRPITSGQYPIFKTAKLVEEITEALRHSTKEDYLVISGGSVVAGLCLTTWMEMHGECKLLLYDPTQPAYVVRHIRRSDIRQLVEQKNAENRGTGGMVR